MRLKRKALSIVSWVIVFSMLLGLVPPGLVQAATINYSLSSGPYFEIDSNSVTVNWGCSPLGSLY